MTIPEHSDNDESRTDQDKHLSSNSDESEEAQLRQFEERKAEFMKQPLVLVTGGTGYLGAAIIEQLLKAGWRVRTTVPDPNSEKETDPLERLIFPNRDESYRLEIVKGDLLLPWTWENAVKDCIYVIHTATPFPEEKPKEIDDILEPGIQGTLRILRACQKAGTVKRFILTSCISAIMGEHKAWKKQNHTWSEKDWTPLSLEKTKPFFYMKTLQEKVCWDFVKELKDSEKFEMVSVNPAYCIGPMNHYYHSPSFTLPKRMMTGENTGGEIPPLCMPYVDVRDVAQVHVNCLTHTEAPGQRILCFTGHFWAKEICDLLRPLYHDTGFESIPSKEMSYLKMWFLSYFDPSLHLPFDTFVSEMKYNNKKFLKFLDSKPIQFKESMTDMAYMMIGRGYVERKWKF